MKDFNEFILRANKIRDNALNYIKKYGCLDGYEESYATAKALFCYSCASNDVSGIYIQCHSIIWNLMKVSQAVSVDNVQEQKDRDNFFFEVEKRMNLAEKRLIKALRDYQIIGQYGCTNGDGDLIMECRKLVALIDEFISYIQDGNIS